LPGDRRHKLAQAAERHGVEVSEAVLAELHKLAVTAS
jgi:LDH2 family malate/lactate/ureidoglycolate dehydrogenase